MTDLHTLIRNALHDVDCPDDRCDPMTMGRYITQADKVMELLTAEGLIT